MEYRTLTLDITLVSAKGLNNVNLFSKMDVYAVVSIVGGDPRGNQKSPVDKDGGTNPTWNFPMKFSIDETATQQNRLTLVVKLRSKRGLRDKDIGEVQVPIKELLGEQKSEQLVRYQVWKPSGKPKGELNLSYKFNEKIAGAPVTAKSDEPFTAYPVSPMAAGPGPSSAYPPPPYAAGASNGSYQSPGGGYTQTAYRPAGYPHAAPPAAGYGYPPQQPHGGYPPPPQGYGYPPQQGYGYPPVQQPPKKNKFGGGGLGLGAGLLGGAMGGMLIGDMISDGGSYDAGFDDGGGFDNPGGFDF